MLGCPVLKPLLQIPNCEHLKITSLQMSYSLLPLFACQREKVPA